MVAPPPPPWPGPAGEVAVLKKTWQSCLVCDVQFSCVADRAFHCPPLCDSNIVHSNEHIPATHIQHDLAAYHHVKPYCSDASTIIIEEEEPALLHPRKRPRTSWGRPHSKYSSSSVFSYHDWSALSSSCSRATAPRESARTFSPKPSYYHRGGKKVPSFLADINLPLHDMPKFTDDDDDEDEDDEDDEDDNNNNNNNGNGGDNVSSFSFPPRFCLVPNLSPISGSPRLSSGSTVDFITTPREVATAADFVLPEDCAMDGLLTNGFCHPPERDLQHILGEENRADPHPLKTPEGEPVNIDPSSVSVFTSRTASSSDLCSAGEEDYTINLSDFEPDENPNLFNGDLFTAEPELDQWGFPKRIGLNLDFSAVLTGWSGHNSPWIGENRPDEDLVLQSLGNAWNVAENSYPCPFLPDLACSSYRWPIVYVNGWTEINEFQSGVNFEDLGKKLHRQAKVLRYKEKRRNRLFSKKIRYEVRKLNAERRPRMKVINYYFLFFYYIKKKLVTSFLKLVTSYLCNICPGSIC